MTSQTEPSPGRLPAHGDPREPDLTEPGLSLAHDGPPVRPAQAGVPGERPPAEPSLGPPVLDLLPVPAGDGAVHAGALGADHLQFNAGLGRRDGAVYWIRLHAAAHHGHLALF